jgi:hypothetical protein
MQAMPASLSAVSNGGWKYAALSLRLMLWTLAALATLTFATPLLFLLAANGEHLPFAHETLAYRYFTNIRILNGEGGEVWLPQGQLITALQHAIVLILKFGAGLSYFDLKPMLHWYSILTNATVVFLYGVIAMFAATDRRLLWLDRAIVMLIGPFIVLATGPAGFYYTLLPDYYALTVVIVQVSAYLTLALYRDPRPFRRRDIVLSGVLLGLAASNKLTLLGPAGLVVLMAATKSPLSLGRFLGRSIVAAVIAAISFLFVFLICYRFRPSEVSTVLKNWFAFLDAIGSENGFWEGNFTLFLRAYHYEAVAYAWLAAMLFLMVEIIRRRLFISRAAALWAGSLAVAVLLALGLWKRGAGTTLFEMTTIAVGLTAVILAARRPPAIVGVFIIVAGIFYGVTHFSAGHNWHVVSRSAELARRSWEIHTYISELAGRDGQVVIALPDTSNLWNGIEDLIGLGLRDLRTGTLAGAVKDRSPFLPITFKFGSVKDIPEAVVVRSIRLEPGQKAPEVKAGCRAWLTGYSDQLVVQVCPPDHDVGR